MFYMFELYSRCSTG